MSSPQDGSRWAGIPQFVRFLLVGALNAVIGYCIFAGFILAGLGPTAALVGAYVLGTLVNFLTTGRLVFKDSRLKLLLRFAFAYVVIYFFNLVLFKVVAGAFPNPLVTQAICLPVVAVFSFLFFKLFVFGRVRAGRSS